MTTAFQDDAFQTDAFQIDDAGGGGGGGGGPVFQCNVFQNNVFQGPCGVVVTPPSGTSIPGTGHWRGPARRSGVANRIKKLSERGKEDAQFLSELDDKPLFTPEKIFRAPPAQKIEVPFSALHYAPLKQADTGPRKPTGPLRFAPVQFVTPKFAFRLGSHKFGKLRF